MKVLILSPNSPSDGRDISQAIGWSQFRVTSILSGNTGAADAILRQYAMRNGIPYARADLFTPEAVIVLPGVLGWRHLKAICEKEGIPFYRHERTVAGVQQSLLEQLDKEAVA